MPEGTLLLPVGGVTPENMAEYVAAGAAGFGIGSALYSPGVSAKELQARAQRFAGEWRKLAAQA
jgi:2-dehydro-3-deoxyphosphogalactonate aldolase